MAGEARSDRLLNEPVVSVYPSLVRALGSMQDAAVLQQLHYRGASKEAWEDEDGRWWTPARYADIARETGLSADQARRSIERLEAEEVVVSCQIEHFNRRKSYRINREHPLLVSCDPPDRSGTGATSDARGSASSSSSQKVETPSEAAPPPDGEKKPRARDPIFDALVAVFGPATTRSAGAFYAKTARELREANATPEQVEERGRRMRAKGGAWAEATPAALVKHWDSLGAPQRRSFAPGGLNDR